MNGPQNEIDRSFPNFVTLTRDHAKLTERLDNMACVGFASLWCLRRKTLDIGAVGDCALKSLNQVTKNLGFARVNVAAKERLVLSIEIVLISYEDVRPFSGAPGNCFRPAC